MKKMEKAFVALVLMSTLLMSGISFAQQDRNSNANQQNSNSGNMNSNMGMNSNTGMNSNMSMNSNMGMNSNMSMGSSTMSGSDNPNALDAEFANMAAMGGQAEIQMANIALERSQDKAVRKYAQKMIKDHTKAGRNLDKVAAKKSMTLAKTPSEEQNQMIAQLRQASGSDFDRMYLQMAGVDAHAKMQQLYSNQATNGTDADLKAFAAKTLPVVQMHLQMAQQTTPGGSGSGSMMMGNGNSGSSDANKSSNRRSSNSNSSSNSSSTNSNR